MKIPYQQLTEIHEVLHIMVESGKKKYPLGWRPPRDLPTPPGTVHDVALS